MGLPIKLRTVSIVWIAYVLLWTILEGCFAQDVSEPPPLTIITLPKAGEGFLAPLCLERYREINLDKNTITFVSTTVLDPLLLQENGQCTWTAIIRNPDRQLLISVSIMTIEKLVQGLNFITFGEGSDPTNESSIIFRRTGHDTEDKNNNRNNFHLKSFHRSTDALWVNVTQSASAEVLEFGFEMELVSNAATCSQMDFTCDDGSCINADGVLNGYPDCFDGSDESHDRGFRDCTMEANSTNYFKYTGDQTEESCIPWEDSQYSDRGLTGKSCTSIPEETWPGCQGINRDTGDFVWIPCNVPLCTVRAGCYSGTGREYADIGSFTSNGYRCIDWADVPRDVFNINDYPHGDLSSNFCRNPNDREMPWCFYLDGQSNLQRAVCNIPKCEDDVFQQFKRYPRVTFDITSYSHRDLILRHFENLSELDCARLCITESSFICRSYVFRNDGTSADFNDNTCIFSDVAPTAIDGDVFIVSEDVDTFVRIETECDALLVDSLPDRCPLPLGMIEDLYQQSADGNEEPGILNEDITASSSLNENFSPWFVRLSSDSCWKNSSHDSDPWIQVDLQGLHIITGIVLQGCGNEIPGWVSEFTIQSKTANNSFVSHTDRLTGRQVLRGSVNSACRKLVEFNPLIYAESVRVIPVSWQESVSLRFELLGCRHGCDSTIGITNLRTFDAALTASSVLDADHLPSDARINPLGIQSTVRQGWSPDLAVDAEPWIQITFGAQQNVQAIITQGCVTSDSFLGSFTISYSANQDADDQDGVQALQDDTTGLPLIFDANSNSHSLVRNNMPREIIASRLRLNGVRWGGVGDPCMKFEVISCRYDVCGEPLRLGTGTLGETISTVEFEACAPTSFEVHGTSVEAHTRAVSGNPSVIMNTIEVVLPMEYSITGVITQGTIQRFDSSEPKWATKFTISYASDAEENPAFDFRPYVTINGAETEVFDANFDSVTPVTNMFERPFVATKLRIHYYNDMVLSHTGPCIRFDFIGCKVSERGYPCGQAGVNRRGYCMASVASNADDACSTIFHPRSRLAVLSDALVANVIMVNAQQILIPGYSHYRIGLIHSPDQLAVTSVAPFVWEDGTPLLDLERFETDVVFDNTTTLCVTIDFFDQFTWEAFSCESSVIASASICQFDIDECLQGTHGCSHGCINFPGGYVCSCPEEMFLDPDDHRRCISLCHALDLYYAPSIEGFCVQFYSGDILEEATRTCQESSGRLLRTTELLPLARDLTGRLPFFKSWVDQQVRPDGNCFVAEVGEESGRVETLRTPCNSNNSFICVLDVLPSTLHFNTSLAGSNYSLVDSSLYLTWYGLPPTYETLTSASLDITVRADNIIRIYFVNTNLRTCLNEKCLDKLTLWEWMPNGRKIKQGEYCGELSGFNLESTTNQISLTLDIEELTLELPPYLTVQLLYESRDCSIQQCNVYCESAESEFTDPEGLIQTFNFPETLPPYYSCSWTIRLPVGSYIKLTFEEVELPCRNKGLIKICSKLHPLSGKLDRTNCAELCELKETWTVSETNVLFIQFDAGLNQITGGFKAKYETSDIRGCRIEPKEGDEELCRETICTFPRALVASPNYPLPPGEPAICRWQITTAPGSYIVLKILDFTIPNNPDCSVEYLLLEGGSEEERLCGPIANRRNSMTFTSNFNKLQITFTSPEGIFLASYMEKFFSSPTPLELPSDNDYSCPEGWYLYDQRCFFLNETDIRITWVEAEILCPEGSDNANLVSIKNKRDMNFLHSLLVNGTTESHIYYIGLFINGDSTSYTWVDGSPFSYTDWFARENMYGEIQPDGGRLEACTAIEIRSVGVTNNWFDIPCAARSTNRFICSKPAVSEASVTLRETPAVVSLVYCEEGYFFLENVCLRLLPAAVSSNNVSLCPAEAETVSYQFIILNMEKINYHLANIWQTRGEKSFGILVNQRRRTELLCFQRRTNGGFAVEEDEESPCSVNKTFVFCEATSLVLEQNCTSRQFRCGSGECLNTVFLCDFVLDCKDGSDEVGCNMTNANSGESSNICLPTHFQCSDDSNLPSCIPASFLCDFKYDCIDRSDETNCEYPACQVDEFQCKNQQCIPMEQRCNLLIDCTDSSDEEDCASSPSNFQCYSGRFIPSQRCCDGHRDCSGKAFEDEPETCDYFQSNFSCSSGTQFLCKNGYCMDIAGLCVMEHDEYGIINGCRDVTHLEDCEQFNCGVFHFKCPRSYCIPQHYLCDGKNDCPNGEDESSCESYSCQGAYKCRGTSSCVSQVHVCDGIAQCPERDDELFCNNECPDGCVCSGLSYRCDDVSWQPNLVAKIPKDVKQLSIIYPVQVQRKKRQIDDNGEVTVYDATYLNIQEYPFLFTLEIIGTGITDLGNDTFHSSSNLQILNLSYNGIIYLNSHTFSGLANLRVLDLRGNPLTQVGGSPFQDLTMLTFMSLENSDVINSDGKFLNGLDSIETFRSDRFYYCCLLENSPSLTECLPPPDEFSSCTDLIRSVLQKVLIWIMSLSSLSGNIIVIIIRLMKQRDQSRKRRGSPAQPILIMNLAIADLLMGCYLLMIAIADVSYLGRYGLFSDEWQTSFACRLAGFLSTISSVTSVLFLTIISIDRCHGVLYPLSTRRLRERSTIVVCLCVWVAMIAISVFPGIVFEGNYYGRSSVCLALPLTAERPSGWAYSFILFIILNLILFIIISVCYTIIFVIARRSTKFSTFLSKSERQLKEEQLQIALKVSFLVGTDFVCWMPIIIMGFLALTPSAVTGDVYAWTAIIILPINSAVNPYLYTFIIERARKEKQSVSSRDTDTGITPDSSPALQRWKIPAQVESEESGIVKAVLTSMRTNRVIAPAGKERYHKYKLSTVRTRRQFKLTTSDKEDIVADLTKAVQYLHSMGLAHGHIDADHVIIDELPHGNKRAYLQMPTMSKRTSKIEPEGSSSIELTEIRTREDEFQEDEQQLESFSETLKSMD